LKKDEFLDAVRSERRQWDELVSGIDNERMAESGTIGDWSVKNIICHISWFEREMAELLETRTLVGSDLWNLPTDERNDAIFQQYRTQPLEEALSVSRESFDRLVSAIETLAEDELSDPRRYQNMPSDWVPWQIVAQNSYEHYEHHATDIRAWMNQT